MSILKKTKNKKRCCSPELIASFLERNISAEDGERVLIHLAECEECREAAGFAATAMAEYETGLPVLSEEERESSLQATQKLLRKHAKPMDKVLWNFCLENTKIISFLNCTYTEPEVLAASGAENILYFRAQTAKSSDYFWEAALEIKDGTEDNLKISICNNAGKKIPCGMFELCQIKTEVEKGICYIKRAELAEKIFLGGVSFLFSDGSRIKGQPVLGTSL